MPTPTAKQIINLLQSGEANKEDQACRFLYQQFYGLVESLVVKNNLDKTRTKDIFQDSIVVLWKMVNKKGFVLTSTIKTLLYSIAFNQIRNSLRNKGRTTELKAAQETIPIDASFFDKLLAGEKTKLVLQLIQTLGTDCQKILQLYYYQQFSMSKIQAVFNDKSVAVTKNRKARCLQRIREQVSNNQPLSTALKN